jgi:hypothetical protein
MSTPDSSIPTQFRPASKPTPTLSDLSSSLPSPEELQELLPPEAYIVDGFIGQGGMGAVYRATQISLNRSVAIKVMPLGMGVAYDFADRFRREAQSMAALTHPHIVSVYDFGTAGGRFLYIVMEFIDGSDLHQVLKAKQMTTELALWLMPQICDALAVAHEHGIVHRDIKPANMLLTRDWKVKVADFGLAKRSGVEGSLVTQANLGLGTPDYAAPEQFQSDGPEVDHRADVYALGVTFYQMLTGLLPRGAWQPPSALIGTDPRLDAIIVKAMMPLPEQRFQTMREFMQAVVGFQQTLAWEVQQKAAATHAAKAPQPIKPQPRLAQRREKAAPPVAPTAKSQLPLLVIGVVALVVLGVAAWLFLRLGTEPEVTSSKPTPVASVEVKEVAAPAPPTTMKAASDSPAAPYVADNKGWTAVDLKTVEIPEGRAERLPDGALLLKGGFIFAPVVGGNEAAVRVKFRGQSDGSNPRACLHLKESGSDYLMANYGRNFSFPGVLDLQTSSKGKREIKTLATFERPPQGAGFTLEFRVKGDLFTVLLDGKQVAEAKDGTLKEGKMAAFADNGILESMHYHVTAPLAEKAVLRPARLPDPAKWQPLWPKELQDGGQASGTWKDGVLTAKGGTVEAPHARAKDVAMRATVIVTPQTREACTLRLRYTRETMHRVEVAARALESYVRLQQFRATSDGDVIQTHELPSMSFGEHQLEAVIVDDVGGIWWDGQYLFGTRLTIPVEVGSLGLYAREEIKVKDVEWQSLDPEAAPAPPPAEMPKLAKMPDPAKWKAVFPAAYLKGGAIQIESVNLAPPADVWFTDGAIRVRIGYDQLGKGHNIRVRSLSGSFYQAELGREGGSLRRIRRDGAVESVDRLGGFSIPPNGRADFTFTFCVVEDTIAAFVDELQIAGVQDAAISHAGGLTLYAKSSTFYAPEWQSLDPLPEAAPKTAAELQLDRLAAEYGAESDKLGGLAFKAALATLNTQFAAAVDRVAVLSQQRGKLDDVLALQADAGGSFDAGAGRRGNRGGAQAAAGHLPEVIG